MGKGDYGIDMAVVDRLARDIAEAVRRRLRDRGRRRRRQHLPRPAGAAKGMDRATADYMGMLATVMNALALQNALERAQARRPACCPRSRCRPCAKPTCAPRPCTTWSAGRVVIFAAGTGNPFFTTDTAATLRAIEMDCEAVAKATQVDGVYVCRSAQGSRRRALRPPDLRRGSVARSQGHGRRGDRPCSRQSTSGNCLLHRGAGQPAEGVARRGAGHRHRSGRPTPARAAVGDRV